MVRMRSTWIVASYGHVHTTRSLDVHVASLRVVARTFRFLDAVLPSATLAGMMARYELTTPQPVAM